MLAALTGTGLAAAAGLNAYIPFLIVALVARFTDVIDLPQHLAWIESPWAIGIAVVLLLAELVLDKIPLVDHLNDAIGTFVRPVTGGLIFAATTAAGDFERSSTFLQSNPWIGVLLGIVTAGIVHTGKAMARPGVNTSTVGLGAPVVSATEDGASLTLTLVAIFLPALVIFLLLLLIWAAFVLWRRQRARRARRDDIMAEHGYE